MQRHTFPAADQTRAPVPPPSRTGRWPSSVTSTRTSYGQDGHRRPGRAAGAACFTTFVTASCTIRYTARPTDSGTAPAGSSRRTSSRTSTPPIDAAPTRARTGNSSSPGAGSRARTGSHLPQDAEHATHVGQRGAAGPLDDPESGAPASPRVGLGDVVGDGRLHHDEAQRVRDHVVGLHRATRNRSSVDGLNGDQLVTLPDGEGASLPDQPADHPAGADHDGGVDDRASPPDQRSPHAVSAPG